MKYILRPIFYFLLSFCVLINVAQAQTHQPEVDASATFLIGQALKLHEDKSISDARYNKLLNNIDTYSALYDDYLTKYKAVMSVLPNQDEPIGPQEVAKLDEVLESNPQVGINNFKFTQKFDELVAYPKINITSIINDGIVNKRSKSITIKVEDITPESFNALYEKTKTNLDNYNVLLGKYIEDTKVKITKHSEKAKGFFRTENYGVEFSDEPSSKVFYVKDEIASLMIMNKEAYLAMLEQNAAKTAKENELDPMKQTFNSSANLQAESYIQLKEINDATEQKIEIYTAMAKGPWASFWTSENAGNQGEAVANIIAIVLVKDMIMGAVAGISNGTVALPSFKEKYYLKDIHGNQVNMDWSNFFLTMKRHYSNVGMYLNLASFGISAHAVSILWTQTLFQKLDGLCSRVLFKFGTKLTDGITGFGLSMGLGSYVGSAVGVTWQTRNLLLSGDPILTEVAKETFQSELFTKQALKENLGSVVISFGFAEIFYSFVNFTVDLFKGKVVILPKKYSRDALKKLNDKGYCDPKDLNSWLDAYLKNSMLTKKPKFFSKVWWNTFWKRTLIKGVPVFTAQEMINDFWVSHWSWVASGKKQHEAEQHAIFIKGAQRYLTLLTYDIFRVQDPINLRSVVDKYRGNTYIGYFIDKIQENKVDYDRTLDLFVTMRSLFRNIVANEAASKVERATDKKLSDDLVKDIKKSEVDADVQLSNTELDAKLKDNVNIQALIFVMQYIFADMNNVEIEKELLYLNSKYGSAEDNKKITNIALDKLTYGITTPEDEVTAQQKAISDPGAKIAQVAYEMQNKKQNFEDLISYAAESKNITALIDKQTVEHYLYTLGLMDAKKALIHFKTCLLS